MRVEMERRFGDRARIDYVDIERPEARTEHAEAMDAVRDAGLVYPVTLVDGDAVYEGAVSYPAILRAVEVALAPRA